MILKIDIGNIKYDILTAHKLAVKWVAVLSPKYPEDSNWALMTS